MQLASWHLQLQLQSRRSQQQGQARPPLLPLASCSPWRVDGDSPNGLRLGSPGGRRRYRPPVGLRRWSWHALATAIAGREAASRSQSLAPWSGSSAATPSAPPARAPPATAGRAWAAARGRCGDGAAATAPSPVPASRVSLPRACRATRSSTRTWSALCKPHHPDYQPAGAS